MSAQTIRIDFDVVLLGQTTEADHIDNARDLAELLFQNPILGGLQIGERVALAHDLVPE